MTKRVKILYLFCVYNAYIKRGKSYEHINSRQVWSEGFSGDLRKGGLVKSIRGAKGGYILAKDSDEITVGDVVKTLDGPIGIAYCDFPKLREKSCIGPEKCISGTLWRKLEETIDDFLSSVTLADLKKSQLSLRKGAKK